MSALFRFDSSTTSEVSSDASGAFSDSNGDETSRRGNQSEAPASATTGLTAIVGSKRHSRDDLGDSAGDEDESLQCAICTKLAEDAVQTPCCGTLSCRACIERWLAARPWRPTCAFCRANIAAHRLITDVRAERQSAAVVRRCCYADYGCDAKGCRKDMLAHERSCERAPATVLRQRIQELELESCSWKSKHSSLQTQLQRRDDRLRDMQALQDSNQHLIQNLCASYQEMSEKWRFSATLSQEFLRCCLGRHSMARAMKVLHNVPCVYQAQRHLFRDRFSDSLFRFHSTDFYIKESNFNVSAVLTRRAGVTLSPDEGMTVTILHPYDPKLNFIFPVDVKKWSLLDRGDSLICESIVPSKQLDAFCVDGTLHLSNSWCAAGGSLEHDDRKYECHCGIVMFGACPHICRDVPRLQNYETNVRNLKAELQNHEKNVRNLTAELETKRAAVVAAASAVQAGMGWGYPRAW
jgi:hypothetical protein